MQLHQKRSLKPTNTLQLGKILHLKKGKMSIVITHLIQLFDLYFLVFLVPDVRVQSMRT